MTTTFEKIEKEAIESLKFPHDEVLLDKDLIKERDSELNRALALGNLEHTKLKIYFEDDKKIEILDRSVFN